LLKFAINIWIQLLMKQNSKIYKMKNQPWKILTIMFVLLPLVLLALFSCQNIKRDKTGTANSTDTLWAREQYNFALRAISG